LATSGTIQAIVDLAIEIAREGRGIGTLFTVGAEDDRLAYGRSLILDRSPDTRPTSAASTMVGACCAHPTRAGSSRRSLRSNSSSWTTTPIAVRVELSSLSRSLTRRGSFCAPNATQHCRASPDPRLDRRILMRNSS
jgi:hypothetical protein